MTIEIVTPYVPSVTYRIRICFELVLIGKLFCDEEKQYN